MRSRRQLLKALSLAGAGSAVFGRALAALAADRRSVTTEMIRQAEWVSGLQFSDADRELMLKEVEDVLQEYEVLRAVSLDNALPPALRFAPLEAPGPALAHRKAAPQSAPAPAAAPHAARPSSDEELAFLPVRDLSALLRARKLSSVELTKLYLERLKRYDPKLLCVVTLTEELALEQARKADAERAKGKVRGPLQGIPWGAKDLIAVPGYRTTWGSVPFKEQVRPETATVYARLKEAGSVLLGKTAVGELAWGDVWFGGTTKNPWKLDQGSSGSSAGSASGTAAGLMAFGIGTETLGSIVSPCTRCGVTGLRPTFGRVSRHGVMALAFSMDKVGAIARSAEDCGLVFSAIHGSDPLDPLAVDRPFEWPPRRKLKDLTVGYVAALFEEDRGAKVKDPAEKAALEEWQLLDDEALQTLRKLGANLVPIELAWKAPLEPLSFILGAEAAATFDELTRSGRAKELVRQVKDAWPNVFRQGQLVPAVEYIRANRIRTLLMQEMDELMRSVDVYVTPAYGGHNLLLTNLTGHPSVVVPDGFRKDGTPTSITFTGRLHGESDLLAVAMAYQAATDFHKRRPTLD